MMQRYFDMHASYADDEIVRPAALYNDRISRHLGTEGTTTSHRCGMRIIAFASFCSSMPNRCNKDILRISLFRTWRPALIMTASTKPDEN